MSRIKIREVQKEDVRDLREYLYPEKSQEEVRKLVKKYAKDNKKRKWLFVVAEVEGKVVAKGRFMKKKIGLKRHLAREYAMYVNKEYRGRGIAGRLLDYAEEWMREKEVEKYVFTVRADTVAEKVYRRREGYKEFGRLPKGSKKDGKYFDVVYMYKDL